MQHFFLLFCVWLALFGKPNEKTVWKILAVFTAFHLLLDSFVWPEQGASWVMPACGAIEVLNIALLRCYAWTTLGKRLSSLLAAIAILDCGFYVDFETGTYLLYDYYNETVTALTIAMIALGTNGIIHSSICLRRRLGNRLFDRRPAFLSRPSGEPVAFREGAKSHD